MRSSRIEGARMNTRGACKRLPPEQISSLWRARSIANASMNDGGTRAAASLND
jgi:hypothetical protein